MKVRWLTLAGLVPLLLAAASCKDDAYCYEGCEADGLGGTSGDGSGGVLVTGGGGTGGTVLGTGGGGGCDADLASDLNNCGACGVVCALPGAFAACIEGRCTIESCATGLYDLDDEAATGCEYECPVPEIGPEVCDGIDNDCDSLVDDADVDNTPPPSTCNLTPGTPCATAVATCNGEAGWSCEYAEGVEVDQGFVRTTETLCDGLDGNCDGEIDESFGLLGSPCDDGDPTVLGVCKDFGEVSCDPDDPTTTLCDLSLAPDPVAPSDEACNGLDDDCDGEIDDGIEFDMAPIPGSTALVDRYEASRLDATETAAGIASTIACVAAGVLPWTGAAWAEAGNACSARGPEYRLCTAAELLAACEAGTSRVYPYGADYDPQACNGVEYGGVGDDAVLPVGSLSTCATPDTDAAAGVDTSVLDLSGNVAEWTSTKTGETNTQPPLDIYQLHGGSFLSPGEGLTCAMALAPRAGENAVLPNVGFRCCRDP